MNDNVVDMVPAHLTSDFFLWLWISSVHELGQIPLPNKRQPPKDVEEGEEETSDQRNL